MSPPRERELKLSFESRVDFERALASRELGETHGVVQLTNWYFDTPDGQLRGQRVMLRLRDAGVFVLGMKVGREVHPGYFDSIEIEDEIAASVGREVLASPEAIYSVDSPVSGALRQRCGVVPLEVIGCLRTERTKKVHGEVRLEFDRIVFPDGTEAFELEVETSNVAVVEHWVRNALAELQIQVEPQRRTKMERLIDWLERKF